MLGVDNMYCPNCGNEMNGEKFCTKCGYNIEERKEAEEVRTSTTAPAKTSKAGMAVVIVVVLMIFAVVGLIIFSTFKYVTGFISDKETAEYIEVDNIKVATVYKVIGEKRSICGYSGSLNLNGNGDVVSYDYCNKLSEEDERDYVDYLVEEDGFQMSLGSFKYNLYKEVDGYVITITIDDNDKITYTSTTDSKVDSPDHVEM